jgi:hypothetical protein
MCVLSPLRLSVVYLLCNAVGPALGARVCVLGANLSKHCGAESIAGEHCAGAFEMFSVVSVLKDLVFIKPLCGIYVLCKYKARQTITRAALLPFSSHSRH